MTRMDSMKTGKIVGLVCFALFLLAGFCFGQAARSVSGDRPTTNVRASWTEFHRTNMERWNPYEKVLNVNNVGNLRLKWSYKTGAAVSSSPAVANGVVYVGSGDGNVYALKASTGTKFWSYATSGAVASSPAVANGRVYVASSNGNVYALKASTGALLWSYTIGGLVTSSPAVANGVVYVGGGSGNNSVWALNANTGALLWSYTTGNEVNSSPAVANGVVYFGSSDNNVYAFGLK